MRAIDGRRGSLRALLGILLPGVLLLGAAPGQGREPVKTAIPASAETARQTLAASPRHGEWADIALPGSATKLHTWVVYPERKDKAPVVIVIHEIFGMTDWVRAVADRLAAEGFIAVAPDLLSGKGPNGGDTGSFAPDDVMAAIGHLTPDEVLERLNAARAYALALPAAGRRSGSIGFCWGGGVSFRYATQQPGLNAAAVYYGTPPDRAVMAAIRCPVAGFYGGDDARVTSTVADTTRAMKSLGKSYTSHIYPGAGHGFLRQQSGRDGANQKASEQAWPATIQFLKRSLGDVSPRRRPRGERAGATQSR